MLSLYLFVGIVAIVGYFLFEVDPAVFFTGPSGSALFLAFLVVTFIVAMGD